MKLLLVNIRKTKNRDNHSQFMIMLFSIFLVLGGILNLQASLEPDINSNFETISPQLTRSYTITDSSTEGKSCFPTEGTGVIYQRGNDCRGSHHIWRVNDNLTFDEYDNGTATITGSVIDSEGIIGLVNISFYNRANEGNTWNGVCYIDGVSDPRSFYQSFDGTITINGESFTVEEKEANQHLVLADGAGFKPGQFGFGAWTGGSFGNCTEWFGNLSPKPIVTVSYTHLTLPTIYSV